MVGILAEPERREQAPGAIVRLCHAASEASCLHQAAGADPLESGRDSFTHSDEQRVTFPDVGERIRADLSENQILDDLADAAEGVAPVCQDTEHAVDVADAAAGLTADPAEG